MDTRSATETQYDIWNLFQKSQIALKGKAAIDETAQHTRQYVSILKRSVIRPRRTIER